MGWGGGSLEEYGIDTPMSLVSGVSCVVWAFVFSNKEPRWHLWIG